MESFVWVPPANCSVAVLQLVGHTFQAFTIIVNTMITDYLLHHLSEEPVMHVKVRRCTHFITFTHTHTPALKHVMSSHACIYNIHNSMHSCVPHTDTHIINTCIAGDGFRVPGGSKDQEILEEGGGAGPSLLPRRDHE